MNKLYTLREASKILHFSIQTLKKYCSKNMIGFKVGPEPENSSQDRRPWYLTDHDINVVKSMPLEAHRAGRPSKK